MHFNDCGFKSSSFMLTDFGLAHPNINPTRRKEIKSLPDIKSDTSSYKQKSPSCSLNVRNFFYIVVNYIPINWNVI